MTKQVQLRRGTAAEHAVFTGAIGELTIDTTNEVAVVHDGLKQGGYPLVGTIAPQAILNKTAIGIGTTALDSGLFVDGGDVRIRKNILAEPKETIQYTGIISYYPGNNKITGVQTAGIFPGYRFSLDTYTTPAAGVAFTVGAGGTNAIITAVGNSEFTLDSVIDTGFVTPFKTGYWPDTETDFIVGIDTTGINVSDRVHGDFIPVDPILGVSTVRVFSVGINQVQVDNSGINTFNGYITQTCESVAGSVSVISDVSGTDGFLPGANVVDTIYGTTNVPPGTTLVAVDYDNGNIILSAPLNLSVVTDLRFETPTQFTFGYYNSASIDAYYDEVGVGSFRGSSLYLKKGDAIVADGNLSVSGVSTFTGIGSFGSDLYVDGQINSFGDIYGSSNLSIVGNSTMNGSVNVLGSLNGSTAIFSGNVNADNLNVTNNIVGSSATFTDIVSNTVYAFSSIDANVLRSSSGISTNYTIGTLNYTTGLGTDLVLTNTLDVGNNVVVTNGNVQISQGYLTVNNGYANIGGDLDVGGQSEFVGDINVSGFATVGGGLSVTDGVYVSAGATFLDSVRIEDPGTFEVGKAFIGTVGSYKGETLSIETNIDMLGGNGILTAKHINVSRPGDIALSGQIVDYLPYNITGIDTTGLYVGDAVSVASTVVIYTVKEQPFIQSIGAGELTLTKPIERTTGIVTTTGYFDTAATATISGIDTSGLFVGFGVTGPLIPDSATILSIGQSAANLTLNAQNTRDEYYTKSANVSAGSTDITGIVTSGIEIGDRVENPTAFPNLPNPIVTEVGVSAIKVSYAADGNVFGDDFQFSVLRNFYFGDTGTTNGYFIANNPLYGKVQGTVFEGTNLGVTTSSSQRMETVVGIITEAIIDQAGISTSYTNEANINVGVVTTLNVENGTFTEVGITSSYVDTAYINAGIVTTLNIETANISNANIASGIATVMNATSAYNYETYTQIGITTTAHIENAYIDQLNANVAITTTLTAGIGTVETLNFTVASGTEITGVNTVRSVDIYADVGFVTAIQGDTFYVNSGVVTSFTSENIAAGIASIATGIITTVGVESGRFDQLYFNNGIGTHLGITTGTFENVAISSMYANVGIFTNIQIQGSSIADSANFDRSVIGILTVTQEQFGVDQINTGVSTFGSATFNGVGQTDFHMIGDARISGQTNIGIGTTGIVLDGSSRDVVGVNTLVANAGIVSSITIAGINSTTGLSRNVTLKTSSSGIATDYTLTLPARLGKVGQVLSLQADNTIGFNTGGQGLYENRYYVSAVNGDDSNDGKTLPTKTIKRAAQLASFDSFVIPGQRFLDAGDLMETNKDFMVDEVIGAVEFNYENIGVATIFPDYNQAAWKGFVGDTVDSLIYNTRFGGNDNIRTTAVSFGTTTFSTTTEPALYAFEYLRYLTQLVVNNQTPPTYYTTQATNPQQFDYTITQDPENTNANYFHRNKDAKNLLVGNRQEIIDKALASVAIGVADVPSFYFPGDDGPVTDRSRYYTAYRLIQKNRQEIIDYAWADTLAVYPGVSATETKCKRDLGFFVDAISTDVFTGGNEYARRFMGLYFDGNGNPIPNGVLGQETESVHAFTEAAVGMSSAICNLLAVTDLTAPADPLTGSNQNAASCANVRSTITTLTGIVTTTIGAGSTSGISTVPNYGYFVVDYQNNVGANVGIATTMVYGGRKCARDLGYIIDAVAQDINFGSNQHILRATKYYFDGAGVPKTDGLLGEESISSYSFRSLATYAKKAITNQLNYQDLTIQFDAGIGTNRGDLVCANTQSAIDNLVGILTTAIETGSLAGIPTTTNFGVTDCADVRSTLFNYVGIVTTAITGIGSLPAEAAPQTQSQPVCIFVEAGNYVEDNPIILYDDIAVVGDNLRNTIVRPQNQGKDLFRVRNGMYLTGFAMKDAIDSAGIPQSTWRFAVAFDDPTDTSTSRIGYATKLDKPIISRSPYIQNCSILSFLGGNGILVDGAKVQSPNTPIIKEEVEVNADNVQPEQGKSMVAAAFTMVSFGGIGWRVINDGYSQVVSCFQIFCRYGSLAQSGGYLSITNSATNFGFYSLRATGFSRNSFKFDRGRIAATGTSGGLQTLKAVGYGRSDIDNYVLRFFDDNLADRTNLFKPTTTQKDFDASVAVNTVAETITITNHGFTNGDPVVYNGDEDAQIQRVIGGLVNDNQYYIGYIDANTIQLYEDDSLALLVDLQDTGGGGIHTLTKAAQDFFATQVLDAHNSYQRLTLSGIATEATFQSGRLIQQTVPSGTAIGYAVTYDNTSRELLVGLELSGGIRRPFNTSGNTISDHAASPLTGIAVTVTAGITTYWTVEFKVDSTTPGNQVLNIANLPEDYRLHFHRPSIVNSSAHTWEYSGSGIDYNALPENGGQSDPTTEQVSELGGRVYSSGTNELGDFKVGDAITAFNRTGNIIFNNTVTIGTLDSIRLSLSGGAVIEEFSTDVGLGDNETGGAKNTRIATQLAVRSFINNRLGSVLDKTVSTNAIPNAVVQLNAIGQINADLVPPRTVNYFRSTFDGGRIQLVNLIPATNLSQGDTVVEPTDAFVLISDLLSQYLILDSTNDAGIPLANYNFTNGDQVVSAVTGGGAIGIVTNPPPVGVPHNDPNVDPAIGYGATGLVKGVPLALTNLQGGSGYSNPGIYTGVRLDQSSGIGTGTSATITIGPSGSVTNVGLQTGGFLYGVGDTLTINDANAIGGRVGGSNFTIDIAEVETRLYLSLAEGTAGTQKFPGSTVLPDYIADADAVGYSTNIGVAVTNTFTPTDYLVSGNVDFGNDRIVLGAGHGFIDGDPVTYKTNGGVGINDLLDSETYYIKTVGVTSVQLFTTYGLVTVKSLLSSGTGTHSLTRSGIMTATDQVVFVNHPFTQGDAVRIAPGSAAPIGVTTGNFYYIGSRTTNSFTLHTTRQQAIDSVGGLILNTIDLAAPANANAGIVTFQEQNVVYRKSVNTSSQDVSNFSLLSSSSLDASNIISGTFDPARLGSGVANADVVLYGDSSFKKVVSSIGIGTTQPIGVTYTSADLAPGGVGMNTYYGAIELTLNRVNSTPDDYSTEGIAKYKLSTFGVSSDGEITILSSVAGGDVDAATLGGQNGSYYLDINNSTGSLSIARGGTGLGALPGNGSILIGNGSTYTLTGDPTLSGTISAGYTVLGGKDITFTNSASFTGEAAGRIQLYNNSLYLQFATSLIGRTQTGSDVFTLANNGDLTITGILQSARANFTEAQGTAPFTVASNTVVTNLNADMVDGINASSFVRADADDTVTNNLSFTSVTTPITTNSIQFNNSEQDGNYYTNSTGRLVFDENFHNDPAYGTNATDPQGTFTGGNGGGILIRNEDGWGAVFTSQNIRWADANFGNLKINGNQVFHAGNDGPGSNLDADTLDGIDSLSFLRSDTNDSFSGALTGSGTILTTGTFMGITGDGGGVVMTTNDGYGNANLTFNHRSGTPDQNGNAFRIETNVDATSGAAMNFELRSNVTAGQAVNIDNTGMVLTESELTVTGEVVSTSDIRTKTDIQNLESCLDKVLRLRPVSYKRIDLPTDKTHVGLIAQEVQEVYPEVVNERPDDGYLGVAYQQLVPALIGAIQELKSEVDSLRNEVRELKGE